VRFAFLQVFGTAAIWVVLFRFNDWLFGYIELSQVISWVFVPAAVRLLCVMLFGLSGALGIWLGALLTNHAFTGPSQSLIVATLSAGGPVVAMLIGKRWLRISSSLHGITPAKLFQLSVLAATCNAIPHNFYFWVIGMVPDPVTGVGPMFVGDLLGTLLVLYALRGLIVVGELLANRREA